MDASLGETPCQLIWAPSAANHTIIEIYIYIGQLDAELSDHWTVVHNTVQPLENWTQHYPTIGQLDTALSNLGQLDTALSNH